MIPRTQTDIQSPSRHFLGFSIWFLDHAGSTLHPLGVMCGKRGQSAPSLPRFRNFGLHFTIVSVYSDARAVFVISEVCRKRVVFIGANVDWVHNLKLLLMLGFHKKKKIAIVWRSISFYVCARWRMPIFHYSLRFGATHYGTNMLECAIIVVDLMLHGLILNPRASVLVR